MNKQHNKWRIVMKYELRGFKIIRRLIGGKWIKTKERGWITLDQYVFYLMYGFDPIKIKEEEYRIKL